MTSKRINQREVLNNYVAGLPGGKRYMYCLRCEGRPNDVNRATPDLRWHSTILPRSKRYVAAITCLCLGCWKTLSIPERLPYYRKEWLRDQEILGEAAGPWELVADAVWKGL